ncbi:hypothetical protein Barb7_02662 [Bacteroidales bacterium Barb7]|nr:hypothetical protein Barb7_02662 [Bacteroidales bacterium Barb7]
MAFSGVPVSSKRIFHLTGVIICACTDSTAAASRKRVIILFIGSSFYGFN